MDPLLSTTDSSLPAPMSAEQRLAFKKQANLAPLCSFEEISDRDINACLAAWGHSMGPIKRGNGYGKYHCLFHEERPVAVTATSTLIRERVGGGLWWLTRENTVELSRLCAARPHLCRIALRMWREFVFPFLGFDSAISYQDADLHNGNTYRFDGWKRIGYSHSGKDTRSGKDGRDKWIWGWNTPEEPSERAPAVKVAELPVITTQEYLFQ